MYLNCKTYFSWRYGTFATEELVGHAVEQGATALALTNINSTCDIWDFVDFCRQQQVKPIAGVEIRNNFENTAPASDKLLYVLLAKNNAGLQAINFFLSRHLQEKKAFPPEPNVGEQVWVIYPWGSRQPSQLQAQELIGIRPDEVNKLYGMAVASFAQKLVILQPVSFKNKTYYNLHRLLRAIDKNVLLSKLDARCTASPTEMLWPPAQLMDSFSRYPTVITNTLQVMDTCSIDIELHTDKNKKCFSATPKDDCVLLEKLALDGVKYRFGKNNKEALQRVKKELRIINDLGFNAYFLIAWDVIRYAQSRGFYYVGRGSGANSIVAYCLQITDVNPIELDLYFERFLNPHRSSPPDFDIDFSWKDRDEVIDYVFKRYGKHQVALLGMYDTFQYRAVIRELGKVFGLPKAEIDALVLNPNRILQQQRPEDKIQALILQYGRLLENFPNHLSIHPGGILISEKPMYEYCVVDMPPKGFGTSQLDMFVAEKIGLFKLDILSQRGLGHIKECIALVKQNRQKHIDIHDVERFKKDEKVAVQIRKADTIGCFYIESPAMRQLLKKLRCDDYITLVAASSIIRPGVSQSGMMKQYIYRFHHPDKVEYLHPKMEALLQETYGVMVYQEDVIKVAHHFAGLDMGEADILRRAMSGKYRGKKEILRIRDEFFQNCKQRGYALEVTAEVWRQIESFSGYSFSKAHSASFAVESYQSLFLKTYYPMEFMVAVINNFGGFYSTELYFHELKRAGAVVHAPCVNHSDVLTSIQGHHVYVGFTHIQGMSEALMLRIVEERNEGGAYTSLHEFIKRTEIGLEHLNGLIRAAGLRCMGKSKKELLWEANFLHRHLPAPMASKRGGDRLALPLFDVPVPVFELPQLQQHYLDDALDEMELLGFTLCNPFDLVDDDALLLANAHSSTAVEGSDTTQLHSSTMPVQKKYTPAASMEASVGKTITMLGYLVTWKPVHTVKNELMYFGTFIDAAGDWLDTVHFPDAVKLYPLQGKGFYSMTGVVVEEFGVYNLEVRHLEKRGIKSRNKAAAAKVCVGQKQESKRE